MEILAFTLIAVDHETPHGRSPSIEMPTFTLPNSRWIGLTTAALSLAAVMSAPGAMAMVRLGDTGSEVTTLQTGLQQAGYPVGGVDGIFGSGTENALIRFQTEYGLVADGIAGPATLAKLQDVNTTTSASTSATSTTFSLGDSGTGVSTLQTKLQELGYFPSTTGISGYYGPVTVDAVRRFQQANGLGADGIAGPATQGKLFGNDAVSTQATTAQSTTAQATTASATASATASTTPAAPTNPQMLVFGQTNSEIVALQNRLKALGYLPSTQVSTGYFGTLTSDAVKAFQGKNELAVDGLVGPRTLAVLNGGTAIAATTPTTEPSTGGAATGGATNAVGGPATTVFPTLSPGQTVTIRTNGGRLNVRSAPNTTSSSIQGSLANGTSVEATGITTDEWVEIVGGWVSKDYVEVPQ